LYPSNYNEEKTKEKVCKNTNRSRGGQNRQEQSEGVRFC